MLRISVIIPVVNENEKIERSIEYLKKQTIGLNNTEIIIVSGCMASVGDRLEKIEKDMPENVIIVVADEGMARNGLLNIGLEHVSGDYVFFLLPGDALNIKLLEMVEFYEDISPDIISFSLTKSHDSFEFFEFEPFRPEKIAVERFLSSYQRKQLLASESLDERFLCNAYNTDFLRSTGQIFGDEEGEDDISFTYPLFFIANTIIHTNDHGYCRFEKYRIDEDMSQRADPIKRISNRMVIQTRLLELLTGIPELYEEYQNLINAHFFKEYYLKNIDLARGTLQDSSDFEELLKIMRLVCSKIVPQWCDNEFLSALGRNEAEKTALLACDEKNIKDIWTRIESDSLVSVIIATHNRAQYIARSIECILMQTWRNLELIIVDDGSTDDTERIVKGFKDSRIKYLKNEENKGVSYSRNRGISAARGKYIVYQDDDDLCRLDKLEKQILCMEACSDKIGIAYCKTLNHAKEIGGIFDEPVIEIPDVKENSSGYQGFIFPRLLKKNFVACTSMIIRKECFDKVGMFDESLFAYEDWDMTLRIAREYLVCFMEEPLYDYYQRRTGLASNSDSEHKRRVIQALYDVDVKFKKDREKYGIESTFVISSQ